MNTNRPMSPRLFLQFLRSALAALAAWTFLSSAAATTSSTLPATQPATAPSTQPANLLFNGNFEILDPAKPASAPWPQGWTTTHPAQVKLVSAGPSHGWVVEMTGSEQLMGTYGTDLLSQPIEFKANTRYKVTGWTRSQGPKLIVFVKGYATVTRKVDGKDQTFDEPVYQMKKEIKPTANWQPFNLDFELRPTVTFSNFQHHVKYLRVLLWAYWPAGTCWYDDVRFEEVGPIPESEIRNAEAVTHVGTKPRLGVATAEAPPASADTQPAAADDQDVFLDAANAFNDGNPRQAAELLGPLCKRHPEQGEYRVLLARALAKQSLWTQAAAEAQALLDHPAEPWQRDWARVVLAEARWHAGDVPAARRLLDQVAATAESAPARQAAQALTQLLPAPQTQPTVR
jgi:hypothetical protein